MYLIHLKEMTTVEFAAETMIHARKFRKWSKHQRHMVNICFLHWLLFPQNFFNIYSHFFNPGYNDLIEIPAWSTNILLHRQREGDDLGCLAIRTKKQFILNGYYVISKTSKSVTLDNIRIDYIVNDTDEIIKSAGNISQSFLVQVAYFF